VVNVAKQEVSSLLTTDIDRYLIVQSRRGRERLAKALGAAFEIDVPKSMITSTSRQDLYIESLPGVPQLHSGRDLA